MRHLPLSLLAGLALAIVGIVPVLAASGDLGSDMAGEACHLSTTSGQDADILCGPTSSKAGKVRGAPASLSLPTAEPARVGAVAATVRQLFGHGDTTEALRCDGGKSLDAATFLFACTQGAAAWPHVVLVSAAPRGIFLADGLPGMMPVLAAALAAQSGAAVSAAQGATETARTTFPARVLEAGATDYVRNARFVALARENSRNNNFAGAEAAWRDALDLQTRLFGPDSMVVGSTLLELALQVSNQQRFDEAAVLLRRATPIVESAPNPAIRARLASYRALDAANQRNYADAFKYARDTVIARQADVDGVLAAGLDVNGNAPVVPAAMQGELAHALRIQAEMAMRMGDLPGAQAAAERALYIVTEHPDLPLVWRAEMVSLMGEVNARQGRAVIAEQDFIQALAMNRKLFGDGAPSIAAQLRLARFYADEQLYPPAITNFHEAFAVLAKNPLARTQVVPDQIGPFLAAASAAGQGHLDAEMFDASQLSDTGVAGQTIARVAARRAADNPALAQVVRASEDAARTSEDLRMQLAAERAKPDDERDALREKQLAAALPDAVQKSEALAAKVRTDFPAYAGLADPGAVSLAALQKSLHPKEAFVSFVIGLHASYVLLVTQDGLTVRPITATATSLSADIADLRAAFVPRLGKLPEFSLASAAGLYRDLLGPVTPALAGIDHLVVAASGDLANLPFSLLVTGDGAGKDYTRAAWLIRRMAVAQIPSARAFMALRGTPVSATTRPFLGVGNPGFAGLSGNTSGLALNALASACQSGAVADPSLLRALSPLPETAGEVQAIGRDLKAAPEDILLGDAASESAVRARPLDQYAVLYFATHGMLPGELHCQAQPGLVLSPPTGAASTAASDGLLTASEISSLKLNARLVVLSACNTAAAGGTRFGGGALEGLADAFFNAGAHAVLASQWQVPSVETTSLMTGMFDTLSRDSRHDTAEALRQAQLRLISQGSTSHPFDWAAFTLIGDGA